MKLHSKILAGTAIGLLMASAPLAALPLQVPGTSEPWRASSPGHTGLPLILVQNEQPAEEGATEEELRREQQQQQEAAPPAAEEAPPEQQAEEPAPQAAEEPEPRREKPAQAEQPAPEQEAPAQAEEPQAEEPATAEEPEAAPEEPEKAEEPRRDEPARAEEPEAAPEEPATAEEPEAAPEEPQRAEEPKQKEPARAEEPEAAPEESEKAEEPRQDEPARAEEPEAAPEEPATAEEPEAAPEQPERAEEPRQDEPARAEEPEAAPEEPATAEEPEAAPGQPERAEQPGDQPAPGTEAAEEDTGLPENAAPVLDSAKEAPPAEGEQQQQQQQQQQAQPAPEEAGPPPESDAAAQAEIEVNREQIQTLITEEGRRIEKPQEARPVVPEGAEVVREVNDRFIVQFNNTYFVERPREERFYVDAEEVYYEELPRGRQREVVVRPDGTRIITVRNRHGDIINRVKVLPDDREVVLVYVEEDYYDEVSDWRDPGADLPPLQLNIPVREYILDAERVEDPDAYYEFLEQPPVERVERTYSLAEVRRSARIRDKVRRIDLDTITFEFGSAQIAEDQIAKLDGVAEAIKRLLEDNPGETFLIEGHTDAVGSDVANLALSDQRAEAVATALTNVFEIPPENLATQGYGEQYLKIDTEEPERENRRVAIRRITPLVAPVASNE